MKPRLFQHLRKRLPVMLAGAAIGMALGWLLRGSSAPASAEVSAAPEKAAARIVTPATPSDSARHSSSATPATEDAGVTSLLKLLCAADLATARDMERLLLAARSQQGVVPFLASRWAELDAAGMFQTLRGESSARPLSSDAVVRKALFDYWLTNDRDAALAALDDDKALPGTDKLRNDAAAALMKSDQALALRKILHWNINRRLDGGGVGVWEIADPRAAAETGHAFSATARYTMPMEHVWIDIARAWGATDPVGALQWGLSREGRHIGNYLFNVMQFWKQHDPTAAEVYAASVTDPVTRVKLELPPLPRPPTEPVRPGR
jgi:hypothetical protein